MQKRPEPSSFVFKPSLESDLDQNLQKKIKHSVLKLRLQECKAKIQAMDKFRLARLKWLKKIQSRGIQSSVDMVSARMGRSSVLLGGGVVRRQLYARSEEDIHRIIAQIGDTREDRINALAAEIPSPNKLFIPPAAFLIQNPESYFEEKQLRNHWTIEDEQMFMNLYKEHVKDFKKISIEMSKTQGQVVCFYYLNKHRLQLKKFIKTHRRLKNLERKKKWTNSEIDLLKRAVLEHGKQNLQLISDQVKTKTPEQCHAWIQTHLKPNRRKSKEFDEKMEID